MEAPMPPPPPELWNFAVVLVLGAIMLWSARLMQMLLTFLDVRHAASADAVLALRDLGASVSVLENASMWHLQQLLRSKVETSACPMRRVTLPFQLLQPTLTITRAPSASSDLPPAFSLAFAFRSDVPATAQVLWGVRADALQRAPAPSDCRRSSSGFRPPVLERVSAHRLARAFRALPLLFSRARRQRRRHKLRDDADAEEADSTGAQRHERSVFDRDCSRSQSDVHEFAATDRGDVSVPVPACAFETPPEEVQSLLRETDDPDMPAPAPLPSPVPSIEPRFAAVIVLRSLQPPVVTSSPRWRGMRAHSVRDDSVVAQCIAIDLLPTPAKPERFSPVVVKMINFTANGSCVLAQEIFGRDRTASRGPPSASSSECAICLEGSLAAILLPCRHFCVCIECLDAIDRCPICRAPFSTYACFENPPPSASSACADGLQK
ncbi:hypothetical protein PINS_up005964 [Pythium insidiosum]|nr:hypothetical protein PINS_up005964 [Pythium insidiosum]